MDFDKLPGGLQEVARKARDRLEKARVSDYEIYASSFYSSEISMAGGVVSSNDGVSEGLGVRVALGKKIGFASSTGFSPDAVEFACDSAASVARAVGEENKRFAGFAPPGKGGSDGTFDPAVLQMTGEQVVGSLAQIYKEASAYDKRVHSVMGEVSLSYGGFSLLTSTGTERTSRNIAYSGLIYATAIDGERRKTGYDFIFGRKAPALDGIGASAAKKAVDLLAAKPLGASEKLPTVWNHLASAQIVSTALSSSINGRSVVEGRSAFSGKIGQEVGAAALTVVDAGQNPDSIQTTAIDAEGTPRRNTAVIEKGMLKSFLFDHYYGKIFGAESTGNCERGSFLAAPGISPTTITVSPGKGGLDSIIRETKRGVLVTDTLLGMSHSNLITGDFSIVATNPYLIENGDVARPLEPVTIAGNLYSSLKGISAIGADVKLTPWAAVPAISFDGFTLSG